MRLFSVATILLICSLHAPYALAWGPTGHRAIAKVADQHITPRTRSHVEKILGGHSLEYVAFWADEIRSDQDPVYRNSTPWHYTTWQNADESHTASDETKSTGLLLTQINLQLSILKSSKSTKEQRESALKFLVHFIGDLHQPLHVGGGKDQGGNACQVSWYGRNSNLHTVWDSDLIEKTQLSYTEMADFISESQTATQIKLWQSGTPQEWANESRLIRNSIYPDYIFSANDALEPAYCQKNAPQESIPKLSYDYSYQFLPVAKQRMFQAGVRLARLLNETLGK